MLTTHAIPSPKILIKDHETINDKGEFPTRLIIPATKFTVTFSKLGYTGINRMLDNKKVNYSSVSIFQESNLKEILEELELKRDKVKISSVYAINMPPSIKLSKIKKAVRLFEIKLTAATKKKINIFLELIQFGMISTLISFKKEY